jgi:hypothetical protein
MNLNLGRALNQSVNQSVNSSANEEDPKYYYMFRIFNSESGEWKSFPSYEVKADKLIDDKKVERNINSLMLNNDKTMNAFIKKSQELQKESEYDSNEELDEELVEESDEELEEELKEESEDFLKMLTSLGITENQSKWHPVFTIFSKQSKPAESKMDELTEFVIGENLYKIEEEVLFDYAMRKGPTSIMVLVNEIQLAVPKGLSNNLSNTGYNNNTVVDNATPEANPPLKDNTSVGQNTNINNLEVGSNTSSNTTSSIIPDNLKNDQELKSAEFVNSLLKLASNTSSNTPSSIIHDNNFKDGTDQLNPDVTNDQKLNSTEFVNSLLKLASNSTSQASADNSQVNSDQPVANSKPLNEQQLNSAEFVNSILKLVSNTNVEKQPSDNSDNSQINNSLIEALKPAFKSETQPTIEESKQQLNSAEFVNSIFKLASTADSNLSNETNEGANPAEPHEPEKMISNNLNNTKFAKISEDVLKKQKQEYGKSGINYYIKENVRFEDEDGNLIKTEEYYVKQKERIKSVTKKSENKYEVILYNNKKINYQNTNETFNQFKEEEENGTNLYFKQIPEIDSNSDNKTLVLKDLNITLQAGDCITFDEVIDKKITNKTGRFVSKGVIEYNTGNKKINCIYYENWENDEWSSEKQGIIYLNYKTKTYSANWRTIKKCSQAEKDKKDKKDKETKEAKKALNEPIVPIDADDNSKINNSLTKPFNNTSETQLNDKLTKVLNDALESTKQGGKRDPDRERVYKLPIHKRRTDNYYNYE